MLLYKEIGAVVGAVVGSVAVAELGFKVGEIYKNSRNDTYKAWKRGRKNGNYEELNACFDKVTVKN